MTQRWSLIKIVGIVIGCQFSVGDVLSESVQKGPYTVYELDDGVFNIIDANDSNPSGFIVNEQGESVLLNNHSDMYLIVGKDKALLIDLSNQIDWDNTARESLRSLVYERIAKKKLMITATHFHGDHLGMLPAFIDDPSVTFWVSGPEFKSLGIFPEVKTTFFLADTSLDLGGGMIVHAMEFPGHTPHSTIFFINKKNRAFTGDAIGSGVGVWLLDKESMFAYSRSIDKLLSYLNDTSNNIDKEKFIFHGAHSWQAAMAGFENLSTQYAFDMQLLIKKIAYGEAESAPASLPFPFLDTNFSYGKATITWNALAAEAYERSQ